MRDPLSRLLRPVAVHSLFQGLNTNHRPSRTSSGIETTLGKCGKDETTGKQASDTGQNTKIRTVNFCVLTISSLKG